MPYTNTCPLSQKQLVDEYFMEHRAQILAVAAFLDRLERSQNRDAEDDFRVVAFREALTLLTSPEGERVKRIQLVLSDRDTRLLDERDGQSAHGAPIRVNFPQDGGEQ